MKKTTVLLLLLIASHLSAQNIKAEYIFENNMRLSKAQKDKMKEDHKDKNENGIFDEAFKIFESSSGKTAKYILTVKDSLSSFILQPNEFESGINFSYVSAEVKGNFYSNLQNGNVIRQKDFRGDRFLVLYQKEDIVWNITDETQKIGSYDCIKATTKLKEIGDKNFKKNIILEREFEVWFTPAIPSKAGPMLFSGLPGLVVYATDNKADIIYLSNLEINPEITENIIFPKKGKTVTEAEFLEYQSKNL